MASYYPRLFASDECRDLLEAFVGERDLAQYPWTSRNVERVIRAGAVRSGHPERLREYTQLLAPSSPRMSQGPFDHPETFGRQGMPFVLVGHPYSLGRDDLEVLRAIKSAGLFLIVSTWAGWYGHDSLHVRAWVPRTLPDPTDDQKKETDDIMLAVAA